MLSLYLSLLRKTTLLIGWRLYHSHPPWNTEALSTSLVFGFPAVRAKSTLILQVTHRTSEQFSVVVHKTLGNMEEQWPKRHSSHPYTQWHTSQKKRLSISEVAWFKADCINLVPVQDHFWKTTSTCGQRGVRARAERLVKTIKQLMEWDCGGDVWVRWNDIRWHLCNSP